MLTVPRVGQRVVLRYNRQLVAAGAVPHHGKAGTVVARKTKGKPRNHLVQLDDGQLVVVPCGQLQRAAGQEKSQIGGGAHPLFAWSLR